MALHETLRPTGAQTITQLGVRALRTAQSLQTRRNGTAYFNGVIIGDEAVDGVDRYDPETGAQEPLWTGVTQDELDAAADKVLASAVADTQKHIDKVNQDIADATQKIDEKAQETLDEAAKNAKELTDKVNAEVEKAKQKAQENAEAIEHGNISLAEYKQTVKGELDTLQTDVAQAKRDIIDNTHTAQSAEQKAQAADERSEAAKTIADTAGRKADTATDTADEAKRLAETANNNTVTATTIEYAVGTSTTTPPPELVCWWEGEPNNSVSVLAESWGTTQPTAGAGEYVWMRTRITYGDGRTTHSAPAVITGQKGADGTNGTNGTNGISVTAVTNWYRLAVTQPAKPTDKTPTGWTQTEPDYQQDMKLWQTTRIDYSNGTHQWTDVTRSGAYSAVVTATKAAQDSANAATRAEQYSSAAQKNAEDSAKSATASAKDANAAAIDAQSAATSAADAASSAASSAEAQGRLAAEKSGIDPTKAKVYIQPQAPIETVRTTTTLWIDTTNGDATPKKWTGTTWQTITNTDAVKAARNAATAKVLADDAHQMAAEIKVTADNVLAIAQPLQAGVLEAQTTADNKNMVFLQAADPHDDVEKRKYIKPGDLWWQTSMKGLECYWEGEANNSVSVLVDHADEIEHMWVWAGDHWNSHTLYAQDIVVNGSIVTELLAADCVTSEKIKARAIKAENLDVDILKGWLIKGARFETINGRLVMNDEGLLLKKPDGTATITLRSQDGAATFHEVRIEEGTLTSPSITTGDMVGGTISGATVTGCTVQTKPDKDRGIKLTGGNLDIYRSDTKRFLRANEDGIYVSDGTRNVLAFAPSNGKWNLNLTGAVYANGEIKSTKMSASTIELDENGGIIQTSSSDKVGVKITNTGIVAYNSQKDPSFVVTSDGTITMKGSIITGGTIVSPSIETTPQANRGIKINKNRDNNLIAYSDSGVEMLRLEGGTGTAVLIGGLKTAQSGGRLEITNQKYTDSNITVYRGDISGFDNYGKTWELYGESSRSNNSSQGVLTMHLGNTLGGGSITIDSRLNDNYSWMNINACHIVMSNNWDIDFQATCGSDDFSSYSRLDGNGCDVTTRTRWATTNLNPVGIVTFTDGLTQVSPVKYTVRAGIICFMGRIKKTGSTDLKIMTLPGAYEKSGANRSWPVVAYRNGDTTVANIYIQANTQDVYIKGGPYDWVDLSALMIAV